MATRIPDKTNAEMKMEAKIAALRAEISALQAAKLASTPRDDMAENQRANVSPIRRVIHRYHYSGVDADFPRSVLEVMAQVVPFFDITEWLRNTAKPGHRITLQIQQRA